MRRGTTPTLTCQIIGPDLTGTHIYVTLKQSGTEITVENPECTATETGCTLVLTLTQEQTLQLHSGRVEIQVRWIDSLGTAHATTVQTLDVAKILKEGVIDYE